MAELSVQNITLALAEVVKAALPNVTVYANRSRQSVAFPAVIISYMETGIKKRLGQSFLRNLGLELVYLEELHNPDLEERYTAAAELLDQSLELIPCQGAQLRTSERKWFIDMDALHYQFEINAVVVQPLNTDHMGMIEQLKEEVRDD